MTALELIKEELINSRETFESTVADINQDMLHKDPGGKALPLGSVYAHLLFSEDVIVNGMLMGKSALYETSFKDKTGTDSPMPAMDENWSANNEIWAKSVKIDLEQLRKYAKSVYANTDSYINSISDQDLDKLIDLGSWGKKTVAYILYAMVIGHAFSLTGEISALKGIQGAKGYPF